MTKRILIVFAVYLLYTNCNAQEDNYDINGFSIGIVPTALFNYRVGYQAEANYGFADHFEISLNTAFLYGKMSNTTYDGYRLKPSVKYYFLNNLEPNRFYIELGYIKRVSYEKFLATYNVFQGAFTQQSITTRKRSMSGSYILFGSRTLIDDTQIYLDYGVGAGLGSVTVTTDKVENAELVRQVNFFNNFSDGTTPYPIIFFHFAIGYDF